MGGETSSEESDEDIEWRWHDNTIHGVAFEHANPDLQDWTSNLVLDIDHISEWSCEPGGEHRFWVAPAALTFRDVTDLCITIDHGDSGGRNALSQCSIHSVARDRLERPFVYWRWTIRLNAPPRGSITFCSSGFEQVLRAEPRLSTEQMLSRQERRAMELGDGSKG